jgi:hypothetical protein
MDTIHTQHATDSRRDNAIPSCMQMIAHLNGDPSPATSLQPSPTRKIRRVSFERPEDKQD